MTKKFDIFVTVFVVIVGTGFGLLTGLAYWENYSWVGMMAGAISSYFLAKLYLKQLIKISAKKYNRKVKWLLSTLVAIVCGVICTTLAHGIMILTVVSCSKMSLGQQTDGFWPIALMIGELIGACAGLIVGGICSWIYVVRIMKESNETV